MKRHRVFHLFLLIFVTQAEQIFEFTAPLYNLSLEENSVGAKYARTENSTKIGVPLPEKDANCKFRVAEIVGEKSSLFKAHARQVGDFVFLRIRYKGDNPLNRELKDFYDILVKATCKRRDSSNLETTARVHLRVIDRNDASPVFLVDEQGYEAQIDEDLDPFSAVLQVEASDADIGLNSAIYYSLLEKSHDFFVEPVTGWIRTLRHVKPGEYRLKVKSEDRASRLYYFDENEVQASWTADVLIKVNEKKTEKTLARVETKQLRLNTERRQLAAVVTLQHASEGVRVGVQDDARFFTEPENDQWKVYTSARITEPKTNVTLIIGDDYLKANRRRTSNTTVEFQLEAVSENSLTFGDVVDVLHLKTDELAPIGRVIGKIHAKTESSEAIIKYSISNAPLPFAIDSASGILTVSSKIPQKTTYNFEVFATVANANISQKVAVEIVDGNDHSPVFSAKWMRQAPVAIMENQPIGKAILKIDAVDQDEGDNGKVVYKLSSEHTPLQIDPMSGEISLATSIKGIKTTSWPVTVWAIDWGVPMSRMSALNLVFYKNGTKLPPKPKPVIVPDAGNRHDPQFTSFPELVEVTEDAPIGTVVAKLAAVDQDTGYAGLLRYTVDRPQWLAVDEQSGIITVAGPLFGVLREHQSAGEIEVKVTAADAGEPVRSTSRTMRVKVLDVNDHAPRFEQTSYTIRISEKEKVGKQLLKVTATDFDGGNNGKVGYFLAHDDEETIISIEQASGIVTLRKPIDRESQDVHTFTLLAIDSGIPAKSALANLTIHLEDVNDNAPRCVNAVTRVRIAEDLPHGAFVGCLAASDADAGDNARLKYTLNTEAAPFRVDHHSGCVFVHAPREPLDFHVTPFFNLSIEVADHGTPMLSTACRLDVALVDVAHSHLAIEFDDVAKEASVYENSEIGTEVIMIEAKEIGDEKRKAQNVRYSIVGGDGWAVFSIDQKGTVRTTSHLDREVKSAYWITVEARDASNTSSARRKAVLHVFIRILDRNDHRPMAKKPMYTASVPENSPANVVIVKVEATDADDVDNDAASPLTFKIERGDPQSFFRIDVTSGYITTSGVRRLDREKQAEHELWVAICDGGEPQLCSNVAVIVSVSDENDNAPAFTQPIHHYNVRAGVTGALCRIFAVDADDGDNARLFYNITEGDSRFSIDTNGNIAASEAIHGDESYALTVQATDHGSPPQFTATRVVLTAMGSSKKTTKKKKNTPPVISGKKSDYVIPISDADQVGLTVGKLEATDADGDDLWWSIASGDDLAVFDVRKDNGQLLLAKKVELLKRGETRLNISVTDGTDSDHTIVIIQASRQISQRPKFSASHYQTDISERTAVGTQIYTLKATGEATQTKPLVFSLFSVDDISMEDRIRVEPSSGNVIVMEPMDYEASRRVQAVVQVQQAALKSFATFIVNVNDENDNAPQFVRKTMETFTGNVGDVVAKVTAFDKDHGEVVYSIVGGNELGTFGIDEKSGDVTILKAIDPENHVESILRIRASDGELKDEMNLHVRNFEDSPDSPQTIRFTKRVYQTSIEDSTRPGTPILVLDVSSHGSVNYQLPNCPYFEVHSLSGVVQLSTWLTRNKTAKFVECTASVESDGSGGKDEAKIVAKVIRTNQHSPVFRQEVYRGTVRENSADGTLVLTAGHLPLVVSAVDEDSGANGLVGYRILTENDRFSIDKFSGAIRVRKPMDYEERAEYSFRVQAFDMGQPSRQSPMPALVIVSIIDENDEPPKFAEPTIEATVTLPTADGVLVGGQTAKDRDTVGVLRYFIKKTHAAYSIDSQTGQVRVRKAEELKEQKYELEVFVSDGRTSSSYRLIITASAVGSSGKGFRFSQIEYQAVIRENTSYTPGSVVSSVNTVGTSHPVTYSIVNPTPEFYIHPGTGIVASTGLPIDREVTSVVRLVIRAKAGEQVAQTILKISVEDVNDNAPIFMSTPYEVTVNSNSDIGTAVLKVLAVDSDAGDFGKVRYSSKDLPEVFALKSDVIVTTKPLQVGDYTFAVTAEDSGVPPLASTTSVLIRVVDKERPVFEQNVYVADVSRSTSKSTVLVKVTARSPGTVGYRIIGTDKFSVDFDTGEVRILRDPRGFKTANFEIEAKEVTRPHLTARTKIRIGFKEDVVKTPKFEQSRYFASIPETASIGQHIIGVNAILENQEDLEYSISDDTYFTIQKETGEISLAKPLDFEKVQKYEIKVFATSQDQTKGSADVVIDVQDVNDEPPKFLESNVIAQLDDSSAPGQFVTIMSATDPDTVSSLPGQQKLLWRIVAGDETLFDVADASGHITLARRVEPEDVSPEGKVLNVSVTDGVFIEYAQLTVEVTRNGATRPPPRFEQSHYVASVLENSIVNKSALLTVTAKDGIRPLKYSLGPASSSSWPVAIDRKTGRIHVSRVLNYHNDKRYQIPLVVEDAAKRRAFSTLTLSVIDINDKPPVFVLPFYTTSISESAKAGDTVLMVSATDDDENDSIEYSLPDGGSELFSVHPRQGTITVAKQLEHKAGVTLSLIVKATDAANPPHHATTTVEINVASESVKVPRFSNSHYLFAVQEDAAVGNVIGSVQQMEQEIDEVRFSVSDQTVPFSVERATGKIIVKAALDRERRKQWKFTVRADAAGGVHAMTTVTVDVGDVNDNAPAFHGDYEHLTIAEDAAIGTSVTIFSAMDRDEAPSGRIRFSLVDDSPDFAMDETSGWLTVARPLDREKTSVYRLTARATDEGGFNTDLPFSISIGDVNDSPPRFDKEEYLVEGLPKSGPLLHFNISDDDLPPNNSSKLFISNGNEEGIFSIDKSLNLRLDRPEIVGKKEVHDLTITAFDGVFQATAKVTVKVPTVSDVDCPEPAVTTVNVTENAKKGTLVLGEPKQKIADVTFEIAEETPFVVNFRNGIVKVKEPIDFETNEVLEFTRQMVTATKEVVCAEKVTVFVVNENDNAPEISEQSPIDVSIKENLPTSEDARHLIHRIRASDADGDVLKYSLVDSFDGTFQIDEDGVVTVVKSLDSEKVDRYELIAVVSDGRSEKRATIHVTVIDQNDNAPVFEKSTYSMKVMESETPGYELARFRASGGDANETISFSLKPSKLNQFVKLTDGVLTLAAPLDFETIQTIELIVVATDSGVPPLSSEAKVEIVVMDENDNAPVFEKTKYGGKVRENSKSGTKVLQVKATDADKEHFGSVSYSLDSNLTDLPFAIDQQGEITVSGPIDFETTRKFTFRVVALDGGKLKSEALVEVQVTDENDHAPVFADCNMTAVVQEDDSIGHTLLTFVLTDLDGPDNSAPFEVTLSGDGAASFRVTDDLRLVTARKLKHSAKKDKYLLTVAAKDRKGKSTDCPLTVYIRQASRHAPVMKPMRIRVNTLQNEMAAGVIGRLKAVDEDAEDVLRFGIVDDSTRGPLPTLDTPMPAGRPHIFKIDTNTGEIWAEHSLPQGLHSFNVTVSDGKFNTVSFVEVHVSSIDSDVLDHAVAIRIRDMTVDEFMREHVSRFRKTIAVHLNLNEESIQLISVQPAVPSEKRARRSATAGDLEVLMTAQRGIGIGRGYLKPDHVYSRLKVDFQNLNNQSERMRYQLITEMCTTGVCLRGECREVIELMEDEWTRVSTDDFSFVSPFHSRSAQCLCPDGFGGKRCETETNRCSKSPCERWQICIPSVRNDTFECTCPLGMQGDRCQVPSCSNDGKCLEEAELSVGGDGYFEMSLSNAVEQRMELEIEIKTTTNNGVLMHTAGRHDFHSLLIVNGSVEYHWNAGSGEGVVRSRTHIADGQWHRITVSRRQRRTRMTVDDDDLQEAFSPTGSTVLNLHSYAQRLVIGARLTDEGTVTDGVAACFRTVSVDGMRVPKTRQGMKLFGALPGCSALTSSPCNEMPCQHAGTCVAHGKAFVCECPSRYTGDRCEIDLEPCGSHPCPPSIQCIPFYNDYLCKCPDGFTGKHCESRNLQEVHSSCSRPEVCGATGQCISIPRQNPQSSDFICNCTGGVLQSAPCTERGASLLEWLVRAEVVMILVGIAFLLLVVCVTCVVWKCCKRTHDPKYGAHCDVPHMRNTRVLMPSVPPPLPPRGFRHENSTTTTTTNHRPMVSVKPFSNVPIRESRSPSVCGSSSRPSDKFRARMSELTSLRNSNDDWMMDSIDNRLGSAYSRAAAGALLVGDTELMPVVNDDDYMTMKPRKDRNFEKDDEEEKPAIPAHKSVVYDDPMNSATSIDDIDEEVDIHIS